MPERLPNPRPSQPMGLLIGSAVIHCLFLMRFFMVAESASLGDSLWIVALWLAALMLWIATSWRSKEITFGWLDLCVGLFIAGYIAAALGVVATSGDKRSALNLTWEWVGIAVAWFLLRQQCRQPPFRRELFVGIIATGTAVAALGLYQHYVDFPSTAAKYGPLFDRLRNANAGEAAGIRQILARDQIPVDGPGLILFEKRLRDSREPLGFFALANTLGGFLAVCLVLAVSIAASQFRTGEGRAGIRFWAWIPIISVLGLCLVLTKSRTAWIGAATGLVSWSVATGFTKLNRNHVRMVVLAAALVALVGWGLFQFGGLDRQVLTEAPKSLQYRLQYWSATWPMVMDHLWLGVGPGQFRSNYLFYKLPEASEEISDPHNLFLDAVANGGIVSLLGLIAICAAVIVKLRSPSNPVADSERPSDRLPVLYFISGIGAIAWLRLLFSGEDDRLLVLLPVAIALIWGSRRLIGRGPETFPAIRLGSISAAIALVVHLAGAGGIGMPAITLLLLALVAVADEQNPGTLPLTRGKSLFLNGTLLAFGLSLLTALFLTGLRPVRQVSNHLSAGDRLVERGQMEAADAEYVAAADCDPFSSEPWRRRAALAYRKAEVEQFRSDETFLNAVHLMRESSSRDPNNFHEDMKLGDWWLSRWRITKQQADAEEAVAAYRRSWARYPTNARLMADLAFALDAADATRDAAGVAEQAIRQDEINYQCRHVDRYLPDGIRTRLNELATR